MTFSAANNKSTYTGNGVTVAFSFPYLFKDNDHLKVYLDGVLSGSGYSITGAGNPAGGTVTFSTAPANGVSVVLLRQVPYVQETDIVDFDGNPAQVTEDQFDLCVMMASQLNEIGARTITVPVDVTLASSEISGTIDSTARLMAISTSGPSIVDIADLSTTINTVITSPNIGDILTWDGINWINGVVGYFGSVSVLGTSSQSAYITLAEDTDNGTNTIKIQAPASVSSNKTITFPDNTGTVALLSDVVSTPPRNHIDGYQMSTAGSSTTMAIGAGQAANSTNAVYITLVSSLNKTTSSWAVGTGNGGLDTGTIANNTWYHFYAIRRPDTGVVDVVFSTNATSPTLPTNYTQFRRIGARRTNGSGQWDSFTQIGDLFIINTPILDVNDGASGTTDKTGTLTNVPTGVNTLVNANVSIGSNGNHAYISALSSAAAAPSLSAAPLTSVVNVLNGTSVTPYPVQFLADTNAQFRYRTLASSTFLLSVLSYVDFRGQE